MVTVMVVPPAVPEVAAAAFVHVPGSVLLSMYGVESTNLLGRVNVKLAVPLSPATETQKPRLGDEHWRWRFRMAQRIAAQMDPKQFGVKAFYLIGSTKNATAGPASDIDILLHFQGDEGQRKDLALWLEGWSGCLAEINFLRTGYRSDGLLDVHLVTDKDIAERSSFAAKIDAITDPARRLPMKDSPA